MKKALAIISYSREHYFELVLPSILNQKIFGRPVQEIYEIHLFQDGLWEGETDANRIGHRGIGRNLQALSSEYPIYQQERNLGVALHFDFIEKLFFLEKGYDFAVFCEDDMILAPGYMQVVDLMADKFANDDRVGMVSAQPGDPTFTLEYQLENSGRYHTMGHNWGFGIWKDIWLKRQPIINEYLEIIKSNNYRERDNGKIFKWMELRGFNPNISSQDYVKTCATYINRSIKLSTITNFGLPIGKYGLHCSKNNFLEMNLDKTVIFNKIIKSIPDLTNEEYIKLYGNGSYVLKDTKKI
jgi:hypothetical protein